MKTTKIILNFALFLCILTTISGFTQGNTFQQGQGNKFLNHPDADIYNAYNMMDFSWWNTKKYDNQYFEVAKTKYLESYRLMGRIEATKQTFLQVSNDKRLLEQNAVGQEKHDIQIEISTLDNLYNEYNSLQQELLVYQGECFQMIGNYLTTYQYNQAQGIVTNIIIESRSKYELGLADRGALSMRRAKMNQNLRNIIYGPPGQALLRILDLAGAAVQSR